MLMTDIEIHERLIAINGVDAERNQACEELSELLTELIRDNNRDNIIMEMADVLNIIEKLKVIYSINGERLEAIRANKMDRTVSRYLQ